ncbi:MAG TPA: glycosyltransferase [Promineifilum sp.]|nr:glycosyltransferase [Promineifilum sp.]HRO22725.1 glycosyltransferase [Promineifilum sp.]HRO89347.1 glycosyltransferase [Promineifilum sp.]HRQ11834.1 glycosyltransferase [Promineifilum sp.]
MPTISVIIPCYNQGRFLKFAIDSVIAQTFEEWEVIIVNDGSTDDTAQVVAGYDDARVRYVYQENRGLSAARNTGLRESHSEYVAFLDADDAWTPSFLQHSLLPMLNDQRPGMVYSRYRFLDDRGNLQSQIGGEALESTRFRRVIRRGGFFPPNCALVRRSAIDKVGCFKSLPTGAEDWDLWLRIAEEFPVVGLEDPLAYYRIYPGSMSTNGLRMQISRFAVLAEHFGPPDGPPGLWPEAKREAYACGYRSCACEFLQQNDPDTAWELLSEGARIWPPLLSEVETYYEFILGDQQKGQRGRADLLDLPAREKDVISRLDDLFVGEADDKVKSQRRVVRARAYLALAMLADQAGDWAAARGYLRKAVRLDPLLCVRPEIMRRFAKLHAGQRFVRRWKAGKPADRTVPRGG